MATRYVETSICRAAHDLVSRARAMRRAGAIIGKPGIGKTVALQRLFDTDKNASYVRVSATQATGKAAFRLLADVFGIARGGRESADSIWNGLEDLFYDYGLHEHGRYLLVDEAQQLDLNVTKEIVDLPERFGFPVVICGNLDLLKRTGADHGAFAQISSRCAMRLVLDGPLDEDLLAIALDFDVYGADARNAAVSYGLNTSIRELVHLLEDARAAVGRAPIKLSDLRETALHTKGLHALKLLSQAV